MKKTITTCDFCGKRVERRPLHFCNTCRDLLLRFVHETDGKMRFEGNEVDFRPTTSGNAGLSGKDNIT